MRVAPPPATGAMKRAAPTCPSAGAPARHIQRVSVSIRYPA